MGHGGATVSRAVLSAAPARAAAPPGDKASPPAQAAAAGFHALVYVEDFARLDIGAGEAGGTPAWWTVPPRWARPPANWQSAYALSDHVATLATRAADGWRAINMISNITNTSGEN